jgi:hypothetical protein
MEKSTLFADGAAKKWRPAGRSLDTGDRIPNLLTDRLSTLGPKSEPVKERAEQVVR